MFYKQRFENDILEMRIKIDRDKYNYLSISIAIARIFYMKNKLKTLFADSRE